MVSIENLRENLAPESTNEDPRTYRCVDCFAEYDEAKPLCPNCGSEEFDLA